jgi:hypothetical protein
MKLYEIDYKFELPERLEVGAMYFVKDEASIYINHGDKVVVYAGGGGGGGGGLPPSGFWAIKEGGTSAQTAQDALRNLGGLGITATAAAAYRADYALNAGSALAAITAETANQAFNADHAKFADESGLVLDPDVEYKTNRATIIPPIDLATNNDFPTTRAVRVELDTKANKGEVPDSKYKGVFSTLEELEAKFPLGVATLGDYATLISTMTTWVFTNANWIDTGTMSGRGILSVNGKSGDYVELNAGDIGTLTEAEIINIAGGNRMRRITSATKLSKTIKADVVLTAGEITPIAGEGPNIERVGATNVVDSDGTVGLIVNAEGEGVSAKFTVRTLTTSGDPALYDLVKVLQGQPRIYTTTVTIPPDDTYHAINTWSPKEGNAATVPVHSLVVDAANNIFKVGGTTGGAVNINCYFMCGRAVIDRLKAVEATAAQRKPTVFDTGNATISSQPVGYEWTGPARPDTADNYMPPFTGNMIPGDIRIGRDGSAAMCIAPSRYRVIATAQTVSRSFYRLIPGVLLQTTRGAVQTWNANQVSPFHSPTVLTSVAGLAEKIVIDTAGTMAYIISADTTANTFQTYVEGGSQPAPAADLSKAIYEYRGIISWDGQGSVNGLDPTKLYYRRGAQVPNTNEDIQWHTFVDEAGAMGNIYYWNPTGCAAYSYVRPRRIMGTWSGDPSGWDTWQPGTINAALLSSFKYHDGQPVGMNVGDQYPHGQIVANYMWTGMIIDGVKNPNTPQATVLVLTLVDKDGHHLTAGVPRLIMGVWDANGNMGEWNTVNIGTILHVDDYSYRNYMDRENWPRVDKPAPGDLVVFADTVGAVTSPEINTIICKVLDQDSRDQYGAGTMVCIAVNRMTERRSPSTLTVDMQPSFNVIIGDWVSFSDGSIIKSVVGGSYHLGDPLNKIPDGSLVMAIRDTEVPFRKAFITAGMQGTSLRCMCIGSA